MIGFSMILIVAGGCSRPKSRTYVIGIIDYSMINTARYLPGFKKAMNDLGYLEGTNVMYIHKVIYELDNQIIDSEIHDLMSQHVDLIFARSAEIALRAKEIVKGTDMPVLFGKCYQPVEKGLVETLKRPGGNLTGIAVPDSVPKAMEWLLMVSQDIKKIYLPCNPEDGITKSILPAAKEAAAQLGIELVIHSILSVEEAVKYIEGLPEAKDAILMIPSVTLNSRNSELSEVAIRRKIPTVASVMLDNAVLITLTDSPSDTEKKAARLAWQILEGTRPSDIPIEISEICLNINITTAEKIGLQIPDVILSQATTIIR